MQSRGLFFLEVEYFCSLAYYSVVCCNLDPWVQGQALRVFLSQKCVLPLFVRSIHLIWIRLVRKLHRQMAHYFIVIYIYIYINSQWSVIASRGRHCFCALSQKLAPLVVLLQSAFTTLKQFFLSFLLFNSFANSAVLLLASTYLILASSTALSSSFHHHVSLCLAGLLETTDLFS